jgi:hypothetical protein
MRRRRRRQTFPTAHMRAPRSTSVRTAWRFCGALRRLRFHRHRRGCSLVLARASNRTDRAADSGLAACAFADASSSTAMRRAAELRHGYESRPRRRPRRCSPGRAATVDRAEILRTQPWVFATNVGGRIRTPESAAQGVRWSIGLCDGNALSAHSETAGLCADRRVPTGKRVGTGGTSDGSRGDAQARESARSRRPRAPVSREGAIHLTQVSTTTLAIRAEPESSCPALSREPQGGWWSCSPHHGSVARHGRQPDSNRYPLHAKAQANLRACSRSKHK